MSEDSNHPGLGFGIDIGGSGIKGAPVDLHKGAFAADRVRIPTPDPATPDAVAGVVADLLGEFDDLPPTIGVTIPGVVRSGVVSTAANIDPSWIGVDAPHLFGQATGRQFRAVNDADAAGLAEARYGAARGAAGVVLMTTLGTGIGSALLHDGVLVPNTELGHLELDGHVAEHRASDAARDEHDWSMEKWAEKLTAYYRHLERLFSPDLFVVGGGISKHADEFLPMVDIDTQIIPALLRNAAGIVGAALWALDD